MSQTTNMYKSALAVASLATAVAAESSSCPLTTTVTQTSTAPSSVYVWVTGQGITSSPLPTYTETHTEYITNGTFTTTVPSTTYSTTICGETTTKEVEHTATTYTGDYTSSPLRASTSCAPSSYFVYEYPGTITTTATVYTYGSTTTTTLTTPTIATEWVTSGLVTEPYNDNYCTETVSKTTATASSTETFALKCAPTNLIGTDGIPGQRYRGANNDGIASYGSGGVAAPGFDDRSGAHKDASACCQACQEDPNCAASMFTGTDSTYPAPSEPYCILYNQNEGGCGLGFTIFPGDEKIAQTGCGYIAENVYADGLCDEGQTPRECQKAGVGGFVN